MQTSFFNPDISAGHWTAMVVVLLDLPKYIRRTGTALPAVAPLGT
jgi:hypothetical protein